MRSLSIPSILISALLVASPATAKECPRVVPSHMPSWGVSGGWVGPYLTLVDTRDRALLRYSAPDGHYLGKLDMGETARLGQFSPLTMESRGAGHGFLLQLAGGRFVRLDAGLRPVGVGLEAMRPLLQVPEESGPVLRSTFAWDVVGDDVVACGDIKDRGVWHYGFARVSLQDPADVSVLEEIPLHDPSRIFCRIGYDYIASLGQTAFALVMDSKPAIYRFDAKGEVSKLSADLGQRTEVPNFHSNEDFAKTMSAIEGAAMPAGLYAWSDSLWVLFREPAAGGGTRWSLIRIDPQDGSEQGRVILPTDANHLTVVPGARYWALVERGFVRAINEQDFLGLRFIPTQELLTTRRGSVCQGG